MSAPTTVPPATSESPPAPEVQSPMFPLPPCTVAQPPTPSSPVPHPSPAATSSSAGQTVIRSGRVIRRPAHYSD